MTAVEVVRVAEEGVVAARRAARARLTAAWLRLSRKSRYARTWHPRAPQRSGADRQALCMGHPGALGANIT